MFAHGDTHTTSSRRDGDVELWLILAVTLLRLGDLFAVTDHVDGGCVTRQRRVHKTECCIGAREQSVAGQLPSHRRCRSVLPQRAYDSFTRYVTYGRPMHMRARMPLQADIFFFRLPELAKQADIDHEKN